MEGRHGSITISEFEDIVKRNAYAPWEFRFYSSRWGRYNGAPAGTCSLVKGSTDDGEIRNIPTPEIPEKGSINQMTGRVIHRGWRALLVTFCHDKWLKPTPEIERLLGHRDFAKARRGHGCL